MGTWSRKLYGNDYACDVKGDCEEFLSYFCDGQKTLDALLEVYSKEFDDEEPLFWYAVADTFLKYGVLTPEIKQKALDWIDKEGGIELWEEANKADKWRQTLKELREGLTRELPVPKRIPKYKDNNYWNIGDVYAIKVDENIISEGWRKNRIKLIKNWHLDDSYFVVVKTGVFERNSRIPDITIKTPIIRVYNSVFSSLPKLKDIENKPYLRLRKKEKLNNEFSENFQYEMLHMEDDYPFDYNKKDYTFLGSINVSIDKSKSWDIKDTAELLTGKLEPKDNTKKQMFYEEARVRFDDSTNIGESYWGTSLLFDICTSYIFSRISEVDVSNQIKSKILYMIDGKNTDYILREYGDYLINWPDLLVFIFDYCFSEKYTPEIEHHIQKNREETKNPKLSDEEKGNYIRKQIKIATSMK